MEEYMGIAPNAELVFASNQRNLNVGLDGGDNAFFLIMEGNNTYNEGEMHLYCHSDSLLSLFPLEPWTNWSTLIDKFDSTSLLSARFISY